MIGRGRLIPRFNPCESGFLFERRGEYVHVQSTGMTNVEIREVMTGLWLLLDSADRADQIEQLRHYAQPESVPSSLAREIEKKLRRSSRG